MDRPYRFLGRAWEDSEERDDEVDAQIRLQVLVRLATTGRAYGLRRHLRRRSGVDIGAEQRRLCEEVRRDVLLRRYRTRCQQRMRVRSHLRHRQGDRLYTGGLG